jgi:hypothetical protein
MVIAAYRPSDNGTTNDSDETSGGRACYQILVKSCLDSAWSDWFDGLAIQADSEHDQTSIIGCLVDQGALHGLLNKVRDLGLVLIAVNRVDGTPDVSATA